MLSKALKMCELAMELRVQMKETLEVMKMEEGM